MIWLVLYPGMISAVVTQLWSEWGFRAFVMVSLGANVGLGLLSRTRRRSAASGWWAYVRVVLVSFLWLLYQVAEKATTAAIGKLTLSNSDVSEDEKQLVALWAAFLLLHLGGPDNLTAYALEDNKLSKRTWLEMFGNVSGVIYAIYKYTYGGGRHSWVLFAASVIVSVAGAIRYWEKSYALGKANLEKMQEDASSISPTGSSSKKKTQDCHRCRSTDEEMNQLKSRIDKKKEWELCDREALLLAQDLFPIWRHAMVDSSVMPRSSRQLASQQILWLKWRSMCKVAEMELSLMYELLYTKAIVAHNYPGRYYLIRFLSPLFTAAAVLLFCLHLQQQQQGDHRIRGSFVGITYALLVVNFLLDLAWLLRAIGSTWAYAYIQTQAPAWLRRHQVIFPRRWRCLHRLVIRVDPMRWLLCRDPVSYRTWSGTIGRYNLLHEAITPTTSRCPEWIPYLSKLPPDIKKLLLQRVQKILKEAVEYYPKEDKDYAKKCYIMEDIRSKWGEKAFDLRKDELLYPGLEGIHSDEEAPRFGKEFEEDVLAWHIATCIVLPYVRQQRYRGPLQKQSQLHEKAITVLSEYMMFLVAVRREMLPGLVLHSLREVTKKTLAGIWRKPDYKDKMVEVSDEDKLAKILRRMRVATHKAEGERMEASEGTTLIWDAVNIFASLTLAGDTKDDRKMRKESIKKGRRVKRRTPVPVPELLELIFNVWVDKLVYASLRCSRESHAKQLSAGGDLTTVLWMIIQHAGPFRIDESKAIYIPTSAPAGAPDKRKKGAEEKKKKEEEEKKDDSTSVPPCYCCGAPPEPPCYGWPPTRTPICPCYGGALSQPPCYGSNTTMAPTCPGCGWASPQPPSYGPTTTTATSPTSLPPNKAKEDEDEAEEYDDEDTIEYNTPIKYVTL